jgi:predicted DCC family thiol-disulfide oxidoreductase YuxK
MPATAPSPYPLTLYYDAACPMCHSEMQNLMLRNRADQLRFVDVSAPGFQSPDAQVSVDAMLRLIHARTPDGRWIVGVDVFRLAYRAAGLPAVARALSLPGLRQAADALYPWMARHRQRLPRWLSKLVFEKAVRRAAAQAAARRCDGAACATQKEV